RCVIAVYSVAAAMLMKPFQKVSRRLYGHLARRLRLPEVVHGPRTHVVDLLALQHGLQVALKLVAPRVEVCVTRHVLETEHGDGWRLAPTQKIGKLDADKKTDESNQDKCAGRHE